MINPESVHLKTFFLKFPCIPFSFVLYVDVCLYKDSESRKRNSREIKRSVKQQSRGFYCCFGLLPILVDL